MTVNESDKIEWQGTIISIQPRTTVWRYRLDNRTHYHRSYNLFFDGEANGIVTQFSVAISKSNSRSLSSELVMWQKGLREQKCMM